MRKRENRKEKQEGKKEKIEKRKKKEKKRERNLVLFKIARRHLNSESAFSRLFLRFFCLFDICLRLFLF